MNETRTVQVRKYHGILHYEWTSRLIEENDERILLYAGPGRTLQHHTRQACYTYESHSLECFMRHDGFTVQLDLEPDGSIRHYCNIGIVPRLDGDVIEFIDLDLDLVADRGGEWQLVDEAEFAVNRVRFGYPDDVVTHVWNTIEDVKRRIDLGTFPFDGSLERRLLTLAKEQSSSSPST
ncbi:MULTISPECIES: DUF402 domain-containing protein [Exiguobacterium]|uniref:DUF402 domain-containing protein n=1 Tax=Exiguobacterium TaxID=33986 RepID=UPI001BECCBDD|nr:MULTISPECIES: DUF402 domain-containing protein [Exiguobacterium]MCT4775743.1 DUF402 domain-containing protein [Exiguobacterium aquaticum]MCT4787801.1 DUF402 domain-containing protein [Exiguobacterium mexicanum]